MYTYFLDGGGPVQSIPVQSKSDSVRKKLHIRVVVGDFGVNFHLLAQDKEHAEQFTCFAW